MLDILRLSLFQLLYLTRVPASAAVDDAVSLTKAARKKSAAGLTNAVLRKLARTRNRLDLPQLSSPIREMPREALIEFLTVSGSHPRWLVERWVDRLGADAAAGVDRVQQSGAAPHASREHAAHDATTSLPGG